MSSRRSLALLCVLLAGLTLATPLIADEACEEPCGSHCGDCASCPLAADLHEVCSPVGLVSIALPPAAEQGSRSDFPRALDHVPLPR